MNIIDAIRGRSSVRAYLDSPVSPDMVQNLLDTARWAPSGANTQPWRVAVVLGETKKRISTALTEAHQNGEKGNPDYAYYPADWNEPFIARRRQCGAALYRALQIGKEDGAARQEAWQANYHFFGAPVGLFFFIDQTLGDGSLIDYGMFLQSIMLAALEQGLGSCAQAALADYPDIVRDQLGMDDHLRLLCGMALGYPDREHRVNQYRTEREPVDSFMTVYS